MANIVKVIYAKFCDNIVIRLTAANMNAAAFYVIFADKPVVFVECTQFIIFML